MSTMLEKAQQIYNVKEEKITPENIKLGVNIFNVIGTYNGPDLGNVAKVYDNEIDMYSDINVNMNDLAILYGFNNVNLSDGNNASFSRITIPESIILDTPIPNGTWLSYWTNSLRIEAQYADYGGYIDGRFDISFAGLDKSFYYNSTDGQNWTSNNSGVYDVPLTSVNSAEWNFIYDSFIVNPQKEIFNGLYQYGLYISNNIFLYEANGNSWDYANVKYIGNTNIYRSRDLIKNDIYAAYNVMGLNLNTFRYVWYSNDFSEIKFILAEGVWFHDNGTLGFGWYGGLAYPNYNVCIYNLVNNNLKIEDYSSNEGNIKYNIPETDYLVGVFTNMYISSESKWDWGINSFVFNGNSRNYMLYTMDAYNNNRLQQYNKFIYKGADLTLNSNNQLLYGTVLGEDGKYTADGSIYGALNYNIVATNVLCMDLINYKQIDKFGIFREYVNDQIFGSYCADEDWSSFYNSNSSVYISDNRINNLFNSSYYDNSGRVIPIYENNKPTSSFYYFNTVNDGLFSYYSNWPKLFSYNIETNESTPIMDMYHLVGDNSSSNRVSTSIAGVRTDFVNNTMDICLYINRYYYSTSYVCSYSEMIVQKVDLTTLSYSNIYVNINSYAGQSAPFHSVTWYGNNCYTTDRSGSVIKIDLDTGEQTNLDISNTSSYIRYQDRPSFYCSRLMLLGESSTACKLYDFVSKKFVDFDTIELESSYRCKENSICVKEHDNKIYVCYQRYYTSKSTLPNYIVMDSLTGEILHSESISYFTSALYVNTILEDNDTSLLNDKYLRLGNAVIDVTNYKIYPFESAYGIVYDFNKAYTKHFQLGNSTSMKYRYHLKSSKNVGEYPLIGYSDGMYSMVKIPPNDYNKFLTGKLPTN